MGRPRSVNARIKDLPRGWRKVGQWWYWRPTDAGTREIAEQLKKVGIVPSGIKTPVEARAWWAKHVNPRLEALIPDDQVAGTCEELFRKYELDELPSIKGKTLIAYTAHLVKLRAAFAKRRYPKTEADALDDGFLRPPHVAQYLKDNADRKNAANKEVSLLGRIFRLAITRWGLTTFNPVAGIEYHETPPRDAYISDELFVQMHAAAPPALACMMEIAQQTGPRRGMVLEIKIGDFDEHEFRARVNKQRGGKVKWQTYKMTPDLRATFDRALELRRKGPGGARLTDEDHLFVTRNGNPYTGDSFKRLWLTMRTRCKFKSWEYTFHDIRAKAGSDAEDDIAAQKLLAHADPEVTRRVYRRKQVAVAPIPAVGGL